MFLVYLVDIYKKDIAFWNYKLYNINMKNNRLTFFDPTNILLPINVCNTLEQDAFYFGYEKNNKANISGFLNHLIPCLSNYRDDMHHTFLKNNNNDESLTLKIEENIYKTYFNKYDYCDDGFANIAFRVNDKHYEDFLTIHDIKLAKYNMDFTNYVRSLLIEYTSKRIGQREFFYFYDKINLLKKAMHKNLECVFYTHNEKLTFIPITIELSKLSGKNLVIGLTRDKSFCYIFELVTLKKVICTNNSNLITQEDCDFAYDSLSDYYEKEQDNLCLD